MSAALEKQTGKIESFSSAGFNKQNFAAGLLEKSAFYGSLILIFLTAIPYGTVDPWFKSLFVFVACVLAGLRICHGILTKTALFADFKFFAPVLGILLLAIIQTIPFNGAPISFDVYETKIFILTFAGIILVAETLLNFTRSRKRLEFLVYLVIVIGIASALFGLIRHYFFPDIFPSLLGEQVQFAQIVNRNHFALLMEMTLGILLGLFLRADFPRWTQPLFWVSIALTCLAVISTSSRGGIMSATGLALVTVFVHFFTRNKDYGAIENNRYATGRNRRFGKFLPAAAITGLLFVVAVFTVAFVGGDAVTSRFERTQTEIRSEDSRRVERLDIWKSTIKVIEDHPAAGVGFGAYSRAITLYDTSVNQFRLEQAHNDYLEILVNGGVIASLLTLAFAVLAFGRIKEQFASTDSFRQASCFGASMGIAGVLFHSIVDFGLHIIVNALIFFVLIIIATARIGKSEKPARS